MRPTREREGCRRLRSALQRIRVCGSGGRGGCRGRRARLADARRHPDPCDQLHAAMERGAAGAINITASHNPPEDLGFKVRDGMGAALAPEALTALESRLPAPGAIVATRGSGDGHRRRPRSAVRPGTGLSGLRRRAVRPAEDRVCGPPGGLRPDVGRGHRLAAVAAGPGGQPPVSTRFTTRRTRRSRRCSGPSRSRQTRTSCRDTFGISGPTSASPTTATPTE